MSVAAASVPDVGAFLARLVRLDPAALVRLRPVPGRPGWLELWGRLPFDVLVTRVVAGDVAVDSTVRADDLLAGLAAPGEPARPLPARRDADWRGPLPPAPGEILERVPAEALRSIAAAAARTLRQSTGRGVGERMLRDAILDHVAITLTVSDPSREVPVPTRLVTGLVRMGFLGAEPVGFGLVGPWLVGHATFGSAWYRHADALRLDVLPAGHTSG